MAPGPKLIHPLPIPGGDEESGAPWTACAGKVDDFPRPGPAAPPLTEAAVAAGVTAALTVLVDESPNLPPEERDYRTWCDPRHAICGFDCAGGGGGALDGPRP